MAHKQQGYRFENDWSLKEMKDDLDGLNSALVLPINFEVKADHMVLNYDNIKQHVEEAKTISVIDCGCRTKMKRCDGPIEVCLGLNDKAEKFLTEPIYKEKRPHRISKEEAIDILKKTNEAGLVHMAYVHKDGENEGKPDVICSCCSCCCEILGATLRYGLSPHVLKASAKSETEESKCTSCGVCVERCHFGARKMANEGLEYDKNLCFGCGLCVNTCPTQAITLKQLK
jgi:Pyruvate/2-oxoacid:ferredoxin oxidoreductase delta subunit